MSDLAIKMIEAKALGNQELIHCIREKITALDAMTFALSKWYPSIPEAQIVTITYTITSGIYVMPQIRGPIYISGIKVSDGFSLFSGGNYEYLKASVFSINSFLSPDDDRLRAEYTEVSSSQATFRIIARKDFLITAPTSYSPSYSSVVISATSTGPEDFNDIPSCLSNSQVENILRKIDEICSCGCGEEVISDSMSKYMNLEV